MRNEEFPTRPPLFLMRPGGWAAFLIPNSSFVCIIPRSSGSWKRVAHQGLFAYSARWPWAVSSIGRASDS